MIFIYVYIYIYIYLCTLQYNRKYFKLNVKHAVDDKKINHSYAQ